MSAWLSALSGVMIGATVGFAVRRARLCTFGAIEDALMGGDGRRLRILGLALGVAMLGTQTLVLTGVLRPELTPYAPPALPLLSIVLGSVMFGIGMALVGTCGFGSLVRLGGGDLRSLVVVLVLSATAYMTLRGILADLRVGTLERVAIAMPEGLRADFAALVSFFISADIRLALTAVIGGLLCWLALGDARIRRAPRLLTAGLVLGLAVVAGWIATLTLNDAFAGPLRPHSLTFVSPVAKAFYAAVLNISSLADFGVGSVFGVIVGASFAALQADDWSWEAFDDDREMRRHLAGAALMGVGGILAGGCTIGQGITAGAMLGLSAPVAVVGMIVGARLGIAWLLGETPRNIATSFVTKDRGSGRRFER